MVVIATSRVLAPEVSFINDRGAVWFGSPNEPRLEPSSSRRTGCPPQAECGARRCTAYPTLARHPGFTHVKAAHCPACHTAETKPLRGE
jgi:hypothetical protein